MVHLIWTRKGSFFQRLKYIAEFFTERMFEYFTRVIREEEIRGLEVNFLKAGTRA